MAESKLGALSKARESYETECEFSRFLIDAYTGRGGFEGRVKQPSSSYWGSAAEVYTRSNVVSLTRSSLEEKSSYLDRYPREDDAKFSRRVQVAHYLNFIRPITDLIVSYMVRKPATREVPEQVERWIAETAWDARAKMRATRSFVLGWYPSVVDMPASTQTLTAAQSGQANPYVTHLLPCHLLDWEEDDLGNVLWAKTCVKSAERLAWDAPSVDVERYTVWTPNEWRVWRVAGKDVVEESSGTHPFLEVPIVWNQSTVPVDGERVTEAPISSLSIEGRRLFNLSSELDEHLRSQVFALLMYPTRANQPPAVVGTENALTFDPDARQGPSFLAPPATIADTYERRIEATIKEIYRMARVEYTRASGTGQSAESRKTEFEQTNLQIADFAASFAAAEQRTLQLVARGLGLSEAQVQSIRVHPADSFDSEQLNEEIDRLDVMLALREMGPTFRRELLSRTATRVLPNLSVAVKEALLAEISERVDGAERELAATQTAPVVGDDDAEEDEGDDDDAT